MHLVRVDELGVSERSGADPALARCTLVTAAYQYFTDTSFMKESVVVEWENDIWKRVAMEVVGCPPWLEVGSCESMVTPA